MLIELQNVDYVYVGSQKPKKILNNTSFSIGASDLMAIAGPSGAGKSTLLLMLNGLLIPTSGKVLYKGKDIHSKEFSLRELRRDIGMLFQYPENNFFGRVVYEDIAYGPRNLGKQGKDLDRAISRALDQVAIPRSYLERSPFSLSGGEKRRVALAGVLAMEPSTLVLDEPTAGLDLVYQETFIELLKDLHTKGLAIAMVTHEIDLVSELTNRVAIMDNGKILVEGPTRDVLTGYDLASCGLVQPELVKLGKRLALKSQGQPVLTEQETLQAILKLRGEQGA